MSTDWLQVSVSLLWGLGIGAALVLFAGPISRGQQRWARRLRYPKPLVDRFTPGLVRVGGIGFMAFGVFGATLGLFFADKM